MTDPFVDVDEEPLHQEIFRNSDFRIYRAILKPGVSTYFHRHSRNTVYVALSKGRIRTERMKKTPSCPTVLARSISFPKRFLLGFQKTVTGSIKIYRGFLFYMPSKDYPVIHRAVASWKNRHAIELLGIEVLPSRSSVEREKAESGKVEIETDEIRVRHIVTGSDSILSGCLRGGKGVAVVLSGQLELRFLRETTSKSTGDIVEMDNSSIYTSADDEVELLFLTVK